MIRKRWPTSCWGRGLFIVSLIVFWTGESWGNCKVPLELSNGVSILLVEDENEVRINMSRILRDRHGYSVYEAKDGAHALEMYHSLVAQGTPPSVVLLDLYLPGYNGWQVNRLLRKDGFEGPVIALSARNFDDDERRDFTQALNKPVLVETLVGAIKASLRSTAKLQQASQ